MSECDLSKKEKRIREILGDEFVDQLKTQIEKGVKLEKLNEYIKEFEVLTIAIKIKCFFIEMVDITSKEYREMVESDSLTEKTILREYGKEICSMVNDTFSVFFKPNEMDEYETFFELSEEIIYRESNKQ